MKKCFCFLMVLLFIGSHIAIAQESTKNDSKEVAAVNMLSGLSIADIDLTTIDNSLTRGAFCNLAYKISNLRYVNGSLSYEDIPSDYEYAEAISALKGASIIGGFENNTFKPEQEITIMESLVMLVRLMGYGVNAEAGGGYPIGYFSISKDIGLLKNIHISVDEKLTFGTAALLCENALKGYIQNQVSFGGQTEFSENKHTTLLYDAFKISLFTGVVDGVDLTGLRGVNTIPPYHFTIDDVMLDRGHLSVYPYLGYHVEAYCSDDGEEYILKYIVKTDKNIEHSAVIEDVQNFGNGKLSVWEDTKTIKYSYEKTAAAIYNGVSTMNALNSDFINEKNGKLRLLDNNGDGVADVVFIDAYDDYVVVDKDIKDSIIYDYYTPGKEIALDTKEDDPYVVIYDANGKETSFNSIKPFTSVTVQSSANDAYQQYRRAYLSNTKVSGTVREITTEKNSVIVKFDSGSYELSKLCFQNSGNILKIGNSVELLLNIYGNAVYAKSATGSDIRYGYLIRAESSSELNKEFKCKIFTREGEFVTLSAGDSLKVDDVTYKSNNTNFAVDALCRAAKLIYPEIPNGRCSQLIRYKLTDEGKISYIDTTVKTTSTENTKTTEGNYDSAIGENALHKVSISSKYFNMNAYSFDGLVMLKKTTPVITHPAPMIDDYDDEDLYSIKNASDCFKNDTIYTINAFYDKQRTTQTEVITYEADKTPAVSYYTDIAFFLKKSTAVDKYGDILEKMTFLKGGMKTELFCENNVFYTLNNETVNLKDLKCGDVLLFEVNGKNRICSFELLYSAERKHVMKDYGSNDFRRNIRVTYGYIVGKYDDGMKIMFTDDRTVINNPLSVAPVEFVIKEGPVMIYDDTGKNADLCLKIGTYDDIKAAEDVGVSLCSRVLVHQMYGRTKSIYIFE